MASTPRPKHLPPGLELALGDVATDGPASFASAMLAHPAGRGGRPVEIRVSKGPPIPNDIFPDDEEITQPGGILVAIALQLADGRLLTSLGALDTPSFRNAFSLGNGPVIEVVPVDLPVVNDARGEIIRSAADLCYWQVGAPDTGFSKTQEVMQRDYWENGGGLPLDGILENYIEVLEAARNRDLVEATRVAEVYRRMDESRRAGPSPVDEAAVDSAETQEPGQVADQDVDLGIDPEFGYMDPEDNGEDGPSPAEPAGGFVGMPFG